MADYKFILYDTVDEGTIARIMMNRPEARNAQNEGMLREIHDAFLKAEADDSVRVVILGGKGASFSSGHDLGSAIGREERLRHPPKPGTEGRWLREAEIYLGFTRRWRDLDKITIAQVQGHCVAAGIMLAWCCDLIVAAENAVFADPVGVRLGVAGVEYFAHPWEVGVRKAKEMLLTGDSIGAEEAYRLGMVSKVFPLDKMESETLNFARRIARLPTVTSRFIKAAVNQAQDIQGFYAALQAYLPIHQMNHAHFMEITKGEAGSTSLGQGAHGYPPIREAQKAASGYEP